MSHINAIDDFPTVPLIQDLADLLNSDQPVNYDEIFIDKQWMTWLSILINALPVKHTVTWDVASVAANTTAEQTVTVEGVSTNDVVVAVKPSHDTGLGVVNVRVSATDTVAVTFMNATGLAIDPASEDWVFISFRFNK